MEAHCRNAHFPLNIRNLFGWIAILCKTFTQEMTDEWLVDTQPLFGYFDISLDYDALLLQLSQKYDAMANANFQKSIASM